MYSLTSDELKQCENLIKHKKYNDLPSKLNVILISVSYDMGWQKRACGRVCDSLSGHGFFVGCRTNNIIKKGVLQKQCSFCKKFTRTGEDVPIHDCNINHTGSSGSMEATLAKNLLLEVHESTNGRVNVGQIITDDDSTMMKHCKSVDNGGSLKIGIKEPKFLADPGHRIKVMIRSIYSKVTNTKKVDEAKNIDAMRLRKYIFCYINQNRAGNLPKFLANARAPIEYLFNNQEFCDSSWCWSKEIEENCFRNNVPKASETVRQ